MTAPPDDTTTDTSAIIAALRAEREAGLVREAALAEELAARTAELLERKSKFDERIEYQAATLDVLRAMSASPGDPQPVFQLIVERARAFCDADQANLALLDGDMLQLQARSGSSASYPAQFPRPVDATSTFGRAIIAGDVVQMPDVLVDPDHFRNAEATVRAVVAVPLLRRGAPVGAIAMGRNTPGEFSVTQMELLKTFAEQAVIAITSAETFHALQTRTGDLQELLEYQTATSDVLKVISRSTFDLQPVLETVVKTAAQLCNAEMALIGRRDGERWRVAANVGFPPEYEAYERAHGAMAINPNSPSVGWRAVREQRVVHIHDVAAIPDYHEASIRLAKQRTSLGVPLLRDGEAVGVIMLARRQVEPFTERQIELVSTFADQAVIAIENTRLITEQREALEQQTATAEVLQVINASPGDLTPVFDAVLEKAMRLCGAAFGSLYTYDGERFHSAAQRGVPPAYAAFRAENPPLPTPGGGPAILLETRRPFQVLDVRAHENHRPDYPSVRAMVELGGVRTILSVPLCKDEAVLGFLSVYRQEVRPFSDKQIALLENFAAQAVIAMENARLLTEQREALEQQTATAEVLRVINTSPGDLGAVFDAMLEKALTLCGAEHGSLGTYDDDYFRAVASRGYPAAVLETLQGGFHGLENPVTRPLFDGARFVQIPDLGEIDHPIPKAIAALGGFRTVLFVPLRKDGKLLGHISASRQEVRPFAEKEITLLENFAAQAVIAMENARLLDEIRQRQAELRVTFENMGDGVAMFDETPSLVAWNRKFQDILDLPDGVLAERLTFADYIRYLAERGEYGAGVNPEGQVRHLTEQAGQSRIYERTRPDGRVIEIRHNPVAGGGFVLIYADITERKRNEAEIRAARDAAEEASRTIEAAYRELKAAQANLIQAEKMASLGQLTAGIAHEIKNPLNFVNNFSALSAELIDELREVLTSQPLGDTVRAEIDDLTALLKGNLEKVVQHGQRADGIVKAMLEHSRGSSAERRMVDLNAQIDEALNLAYHGARAQDQSFNVTLERDFAEGIVPIEVNPQDMTRVFLNIFSNGFYAATRRARNGGEAEFMPMLKVTTRDAGEVVEIRVRDNGTGIPAEIRDKLFQPFFTTKPTGEGTGLGLSITYDIVTKQHGGTITVESEVNEFTEFTITLPRQMFTNGGSRA